MLEVLSLTADAQQRSSTAVIFGFTRLLIVLGLNILLVVVFRSSVGVADDRLGIVHVTARASVGGLERVVQALAIG